MLTCKDCGNTERFSVGAKEYHRWLVDGDGHYIEDLDCGDTDEGDDYQCMKCDSWNVERK